VRADLDLEKLEQILEERQNRILQRVNLKNENDPTRVRNPDSSDLAQDYYMQERNSVLNERLEGTLEQVEAALYRLKVGSFGTCKSCGKNISAARLEALPLAELCIDCQKEEERKGQFRF
jgi:DnaK suppressor protein